MNSEDSLFLENSEVNNNTPSVKPNPPEPSHPVSETIEQPNQLNQPKEIQAPVSKDGENKIQINPEILSLIMKEKEKKAFQSKLKFIANHMPDVKDDLQYMELAEINVFYNDLVKELGIAQSSKEAVTIEDPKALSIIDEILSWVGPHLTHKELLQYSIQELEDLHAQIFQKMKETEEQKEFQQSCQVQKIDEREQEVKQEFQEEEKQNEYEKIFLEREEKCSREAKKRTKKQRKKSKMEEIPDVDQIRKLLLSTSQPVLAKRIKNLDDSQLLQMYFEIKKEMSLPSFKKNRKNSQKQESKDILSNEQIETGSTTGYKRTFMMTQQLAEYDENGKVHIIDTGRPRKVVVLNEDKVSFKKGEELKLRFKQIQKLIQDISSQ